MKRIDRAGRFLCILLTLCLLCACGSNHDDAGNAPEDLAVCIGGSIGTLDPIYAETAQDMTVVNHLYENLMKLAEGKDGTVAAAPAMAKSCETVTNPDGTVTCTFRLRDARWSDGTAVTAGDFVYAWRRLADPAAASPHARLLSVVAGFDAVQTSGDPSFLQVEAVSDDEFAVTLTGVCEWFLTDVCTSTAAMPLRKTVVEKIDEYGGVGMADPAQMVTNGPYRIDAWDDDAVTLAQNPRYAGNEDGPRRIVLRRADDPEAGWALYENGAVDLLAPLTESRLALLAEQEDWQPVAEPVTTALLFNTDKGLFTDPTVRQAFQLTVDRAALAETAGAGTRPAGGLVPPCVPDPDAEDGSFRSHGGDLVNVSDVNSGADSDAALALLAENGYDIDMGWASAQLLHPDTAYHAAVARALAARWSAILQAAVTPVAMPEEELSAALSAGDYAMALTDITGFANDAYAFLERWETGHPLNVTGYSNSAFDTLLSVIRSIGDDSARRGCLHDAESLLLEDCPLTPLLFSVTDHEVRENLTGIVRDARGFFRLTDVRYAEEAN